MATSKACRYASNDYTGKYRENHCFVTLKNKIERYAVSSGPWGPDDIMHWFDDGSMLLERTIVKEFQLFKG